MDFHLSSVWLQSFSESIAFNILVHRVDTDARCLISKYDGNWQEKNVPFEDKASS